MENEEGKEAVTSPATEEQIEPVQEQEQPELENENGVYSGTATKMFTQSQVDEIAGKTRKEAETRALKKVYGRYGVSNEEELDDLFGNAQRYDTLKEQYDEESAARAEKDKKFQEMSEQLALLRSGIDEDAFEDATLILKGKGMDVTLENIQKELETHPFWKKEKGHDVRFQKKQNGATKLSVLGNDGADTPTSGLTEQDIALKQLFKV